MHSRIPVKISKTEDSEDQRRADPQSEVIPPAQSLQEASEQVINTWNKVMYLKQLLELTAGGPKEPNLDQSFLIEATEMVIAKAIKSIENIAALEAQLIFWRQDGPTSLLDQINECKQYFEGKLRVDMVVLGLYMDHLEGKRLLPRMERIKNIDLSDGTENLFQMPSSNDRAESETSGDSTESDAVTGTDTTDEPKCGTYRGSYIFGTRTKESQSKLTQEQSSLQ
ncbi:hypothetical protein ACMFMG_011044 [Clarireedia jacksonii]